MQLKQRLKKIEDQWSVNNSGSDFCDCKDDEYWRAMEEYYNARREGKEAPVLTHKYAPNLETKRCDYCKKPLPLAEIKYLENLMKAYGAKHQTDDSDE